MAFAAHMLFLMENERVQNIRNLNLYRRHLRDATNPFDLRDLEFQRLFRVDKETARYLINRLMPRLNTRRPRGLTPQVKVLVTLRFLAHGCYQRAVGQEFFIAMSQPSVSNCVRKTTRAIFDEFMNEIIHVPSTNREREQVESRFREVAGFPGVLGCIDCTHVAIVTPWVQEDAYKNHHGYYSLNVQMVCDNQLKITNVNANFPGSVHDNFIFNNSIIKNEMTRLHNDRIGTYFLLGDSGYALQKFLLTPILNAEPGSPQERYTQRHCHIRNKIERVFGILKAVWRCLLKDRTLHYQPRTAAYIVCSCAILHNMLLGRVPLPDIHIIDDVPFPRPNNANEIDRREGQRIRDNIVQTYFNN